MSCPGRADLDAIFAAGSEGDPARRTATIAHVRGCPRCQELLREPELGEVLPGRSRSTRPRVAIILLAAIGLVLAGLGRIVSRLPRGEVAPVSSGP